MSRNDEKRTPTTTTIAYLTALLALVSFLGWLGYLRHTNSPLVIQVSIPAEEILDSDPIIVRVTLTNTSRMPLTINGRMAFDYSRPFCDVCFWIRPAPGMRLSSGGTRRVVEDDIIQLLPGEQISQDYNLSDRFPLYDPKTHELVAEYNNDQEVYFGVSVWTGTILSDPVQITVDEGGGGDSR